MPIDIFDELELSVEDKILLSDEFRKYLIDEIKKEIGKLPVDKIIKKVVSDEMAKQTKMEDIAKQIYKQFTLLKDGLKSDQNKIFEKSKEMEKDINLIKSESKDSVDSALKEIKKEHEEFIEKMRKKYDELKTLTLNQPQYQFGGFSPQFNDLNIGDPGTEGGWRIVKSGNDLSFQRYESGAWVEKGVMTA